MTKARLALGLILGCLGVSACSVLAPIPDRSRFFTLTATPAAHADHDRTPGRRASGTPEVVYGLGPIIIPAYLDRNQVATRVSPTEVAYSQWERWAEPLGTNVSLVLLQNLSSELETDGIVSYPWLGSARVDYQIAIRLLRLESDTTGESHLKARWSITDVERAHQLVAQETSLTRRGQPNDTTAATAALSAMLGDLAHEIANALHALPPRSSRKVAR